MNNFRCDVCFQIFIQYCHLLNYRPQEIHGWTNRGVYPRLASPAVFSNEVYCRVWREYIHADVQGGCLVYKTYSTHLCYVLR